MYYQFHHRGNHSGPAWGNRTPIRNLEGSCPIHWTNARINLVGPSRFELETDGLKARCVTITPRSHIFVDQLSRLSADLPSRPSLLGLSVPYDVWGIIYWQGMRESNPQLLNQNQMLYRLTNPHQRFDTMLESTKTMHSNMVSSHVNNNSKSIVSVDLIPQITLNFLKSVADLSACWAS